MRPAITLTRANRQPWTKPWPPPTRALDEIDRKIKDYSAVLVKQERIGDSLVEKKMRIKLRQKPFSVYLYFLEASNENIKGREVIYAEGRNDNWLLVHTPGLLDITVPLPPAGLLATHGEHYPITEIGIANLCRQLIKRGEAAADSGKVQVERFRNTHIQDRNCTTLEVTYPVHEKTYRGYLARIFVDDELHIPLCVKVYGLPLDAAKGPELVEAYTYLDLKINNGYTDADFDRKNRQYKFP